MCAVRGEGLCCLGDGVLSKGWCPGAVLSGGVVQVVCCLECEQNDRQV